MSMYATARDILDRYAATGLFLSGMLDDGTPDTAPLDRALEEAGSEIDAALRGRYRLPVSPVPPVLRRVAVDMAVDAVPRNGAEYADLFERRAKIARQLLADIAAGKTDLDLPEASGGRASGGVLFAGPSGDFRQTLEGM